MTGNNNQNDNAPDVYWEDKQKPCLCIGVHTIVEAYFEPQVKIHPGNEPTKELIANVVGKENSLVCSDYVGIEDEAIDSSHWHCEVKDH